MRARVLDLFGGAAGAGMGYYRAGWEVLALDNVPHPENPFPMLLADAMQILKQPRFLDAFDLVHASPPCPRYSRITPEESRDKHPDYVPKVRELLIAWGGRYVIENVPGAPLIDPVRLCGSSFGLRCRRHRLFESNMPLEGSVCDHASQGQPVGIYGQHPDRPGGFKRPSGTSRGIKAASIAEAQEALGIDWMTTWSDLADSVPPAYTEYVGRQIAHQMRKAA